MTMNMATQKKPKYLKRFNCLICGKKLTKEEHEVDTGNLCEECRKETINSSQGEN